MKRFIEGQDRSQSTLFPERLEDWVGEDNPVRVIDVFVDELDLGDLGFRRLEVEGQRNVELMWLTRRLAPDFKTIADFRKDNGKAIRSVCAQFVALCRQLNLFAGSMVAIDGSKFKAVNRRDKNFTSAKMKRRIEQIEESIGRYLSQLDSADRQEPSVREAKTVRLGDKISKLKEEMQRLKELESERLEHPDKQISETDPDARSMATSGRGSGIVGYNVQAAVDSEHHLIVAHEVTNVGNDREQLSSMAKQARTAIDIERLEVVADRGYFEGHEILACHDAGITAFVPKPLTSLSKASGRFGKQDFRYIPEDDEYLCPAGDRLVRRFATEEKGKTLHVYWSSACQACSIRQQCTTARARRIKRWEHEAVLDAMQRRLDRNPNMMGVRRETVEHPFGTIKSWMGSTHFLTKTLDRVGTEMALHVLAYNLKRVINIIGVRPLIQAMQTA